MADDHSEKTHKDIESVTDNANSSDIVQTTGDTGKRSISTGGGAYVEGDINTGGGAFVGRDQNIIVGSHISEVAQLFKNLDAAIENYPTASAEDKADLRAEINDMKAHADEKGDSPDETFMARRMRNIARMAPDILDVIIATVTNPTSGFLMIAKKSAEKAKQLVGK